MLAFWASLLSLSLAVLLLHALARWQFLRRQLLTICVCLPLILPPVVIGYVLLLVFGQTALAGRILRIPLVSFDVSSDRCGAGGCGHGVSA